MSGGIALTLWNWTTERTGFIFWFTALGLPFCLWGLFFSLRRFAYKAEQVGLSPGMWNAKRLLIAKLVGASAVPGYSIHTFNTFQGIVLVHW